MANQIPRIRLNPVRVLIALIGIIVSLVALSIWGQYLRYFQSFVDIRPWMEIGLDFLNHKLYMDAETNIPTWFNTALLLWIAMLFLLVGALKVQAKAPFRWHWIGLAILFCTMSIDELSVLHEMLIKPFRDWSGLGGWFYFAWVIPAILFLALMAAAYAVFFYRLEGTMRIRMVSSLAVYFAGAVGGEMLSGRFASAIGQRNFEYAVIATLEESVEMVGAALLIYTLLKYLARQYGTVTLLVGSSRTAGDET